MHQESLLKDRRPKVRRGKRLRRVIVTFDLSTHSLIEATAYLGGYASVEEYAREAISEKFESDRTRCREAMARE